MSSLLKNSCYATLLLFTAMAGVSCGNKEEDQVAAEVSPGGTNAERDSLNVFRCDTRSLFNNRNFAELEKRADKLRADKEKFANGTWKLTDFYDSLRCEESEPESMWQLHQQIYQTWQDQFPKSITVQVAHAQFMGNYAWQARGSGYSDSVTEEGWRLFHERLAIARTILDQSKSLGACPVWWTARFRVALGQGEDPEAYELLFREAKDAEPHYFAHDASRAYFLLPRWHGEPGEWEAAAESEIEREGGLGHEGYARVLRAQARFYDNVFSESNASWRKAKLGFEEMRSRYPDSKEVLNTYCRMACFAGDRKLARKLFDEIGEHREQVCWRTQGDEFGRARAWAMKN